MSGTTIRFCECIPDNKCAVIRTAELSDAELLLSFDRHISPSELESIIGLGRVFILECEGRFAGWLRYGLFWDNTPFMNMLFLLEEYRGRGLGAGFVKFWERKMAEYGYSEVMTSTASDEYAQHFYNRLGYMTVGGFAPSGEPFELILSKNLSQEKRDR
ncbi:MAG: GNAT family N-acetyltransferase [Huintestinicola sp.]|uniref:GNAT family N-acetyltransferase n=1 Tax=Huintestinicola sp. TaxID=2981661 RepID=UPI003F0E23DB